MASNLTNLIKRSPSASATPAPTSSDATSTGAVGIIPPDAPKIPAPVASAAPTPKTSSPVADKTTNAPKGDTVSTTGNPGTSSVLTLYVDCVPL